MTKNKPIIIFFLKFQTCFKNVSLSFSSAIIIIIIIVIIILWALLFFFMPYPFWTWAIMDFHKIMSFTAQSNCSAFTRSIYLCPVSHSLKLILCFSCHRYVLSVLNFPRSPSSLWIKHFLNIFILLNCFAKMYRKCFYRWIIHSKFLSRFLERFTFLGKPPIMTVRDI